jgi:ABC-type polysaccharide/polyol phosphate export permease
VFYPLHRVPERFRALIEANPMTGVVEMFRASIGGADRGWVTAALISGVWAIGAAVLGVWLQARWDRVFADLL